MKIDRVNAVILRELLKDARKSFTEIAEQCGESKAVVASRYRQMKKQGVIVGATIQNSFFCYDSNVVVSFDIITRPHKFEAATKQLKSFPKVIEVYPVGINPSINAVFSIKSVAELEQTRQAIKQLPDVLEVDTQIWIGMRNRPHNLSVLNFGEAEEKEEIPENKAGNAFQLDEVDRYIIEKLVVDSRVPFNKLAKELHVATDTVTKRYERLKRNRLVKPVLRINPLKIGYKAFASFKMTFSEDCLNESIEELSAMPDINIIHKISGKFDVWAILMISDIEQFTAVQARIMKMKYLTNIEVSVSGLFTVWPLQREFISTF